MATPACGRCAHFYLVQAEDDWSDITPGNQFSMSCNKNHWQFDAHTVTAAELVRIFTAAETCPDYVTEVG